MNILIVEDESITALEIQDYLLGFGYQNVYTASTPNEAFEIIKEKHIQLILMDINLNAEFTGIQIIQNTKKKHENIEVIYITAFSDEKTMNEAILTEPVYYLSKPFKSFDLKVAIKIMQNKNNSRQQDDNNLIYFFDAQFSYNQQTKEFFHNEIKIKLPKRERKLLDAIIPNIKNKFISNEQIEHAVWEDSTNVKDATRRVVISDLNKKFNHKLLTNVYGEGQRINS